MWERTGRDSGKPYQYMRLELDQQGGAPKQEEEETEIEDDGLPF